jgi:hypothetical protein
MDYVREAPWSLIYDELIKVKVQACNLNGCGLESEANTVGAQI